jgi:glycosyltransferase involved in cell wall biosynthesis
VATAARSELALSLITLGDPGGRTGGYLYHARMAEAAPRHEAEVGFVCVPDRVFPLPILEGRRVLAQALARSPDAILVDSIAAAFVAPWLAQRTLEMPLVGVLHQAPGGIGHRWPRRLVQAGLDSLLYRRATRLLVASEALVPRLVERGVQSARIRVVPPGRDIVEAQVRTTRDLRHGRDAAFLCVANWIPHKGILELLDAFAGVPDSASRLHLAGDGEADRAYGAKVLDRLSEPDLNGRVIVHGWLPREQLAALYHSCDVFVLPAFNETYGTVFGEAMACGLPVVGWRAGNLPELAEHEREGILLEPGDVQALCCALSRLATDPALRSRLGAAGRKRARSNPTWEESASAFFAAIREVVQPAG